MTELSSPWFDDWMLVRYRPKTLRRIVEDSAGNQRLQKASLWTLEIKRNGYNIVGFTDETGEKQSSFTLETGPETGFTYTATGKSFICDDDAYDLVDEQTGHYVNTQVWVWQSEFEDTPGDEFDPPPDP